MFSEFIYDFRDFFMVSYTKLSTKFTYDISFGILPRRFKAGEEIYKEDDDVEEIYLITKGIVSAGFTIRGVKFRAKEIQQKSTVGDYYVLKGRKSEFLYEAETEVEAMGITGEFFMSVLNNYPDKKAAITNRSSKLYTEFREQMKTARRRKLANANLLSDYCEILISDKTKEDNVQELVYGDGTEAETDQEIKNKIDGLIEEINGLASKLENAKKKLGQEFEEVGQKLSSTMQ